MREEMRKDRAEESPTARRGRTVKETVPMSGTNLWCRKKQERQGQEKRASYLLPITHRRFVRFGCIRLRDVPIALGRFVRFVVGLALKAPDPHGLVVRRARQAPRVAHTPLLCPSSVATHRAAATSQIFTVQSPDALAKRPASSTARVHT